MSVQSAQRLDVDRDADVRTGENENPSIAEPSLANLPEPGPVPAASNRGLPARWLLTVVLAAAVGGGGVWYQFVHLPSSAGNSAGNSAGHKDAADQAPSDGGNQEQGKATLGFVDASDKSKRGDVKRCPVVRVEVAPRYDILRLTGTLQADERSSVASNTSGIVAEIRVDRGSLVRKGDVLVQIDPTDAKNKLAEGEAMLDELKARLGIDEHTVVFDPEDEPEVRLAKASADLAASNLKRAKDLIAKKVISTEAFDQTNTEYDLAAQRYRQAIFQIRQAYAVCKTAQIKLEILRKAVADTTIRAPFDGWVAEKLVAVGEQISSGMQATKVITLVRVDPLRLSLTVPQQDMGRIRPGQTVRFRVDSFPDRDFAATVQFIAPVVANDTRSMVVEAVAPNSDNLLRPGLFATAELELKQKQLGMYIPLRAVEKTGEVARVFVVRGGIAREQVVALGEVERGKVEILAGLTGRETLVANPDAIHDGDAVSE